MTCRQIQAIPLFPGKRQIRSLADLFQPGRLRRSGHQLHLCRMAQDPCGRYGCVRHPIFLRQLTDYVIEFLEFRISQKNA